LKDVINPMKNLFRLVIYKNYQKNHSAFEIYIEIYLFINV